MSSQLQNESGWFSVNEACEILDVSRRTIYNWINNKTVSTKTENKHRFVWLHFKNESDDEVDESGYYTDLHEKGANLHENGSDLRTDAQLQLDGLKEQIEYFKTKCDRLEEQISEQSMRHDAVVLKLSGTLENQQLMLEQANNKSFLAWLFGKA